MLGAIAKIKRKSLFEHCINRELSYLLLDLFFPHYLCSANSCFGREVYIHFDKGHVASSEVKIMQNHRQKHLFFCKGRREKEKDSRNSTGYV